jgi:hypothetical protein
LGTGQPDERVSHLDAPGGGFAAEFEEYLAINAVLMPTSAIATLRGYGAPGP